MPFGGARSMINDESGDTGYGIRARFYRPFRICPGRSVTLQLRGSKNTFQCQLRTFLRRARKPNAKPGRL